MNNEQFRKLLASNAAKSPDGAGKPSQARPSRSPGALGSRQRANIPMTPRSVGLSSNVDFARQVADRNRAANPQKKPRISAPKGARLAAGYVDRTKSRQEVEDEKTQRINALEELLEKEEIDKSTFEKLRGEIVGGDLSSTHMVKGLDFKLLERIRRGENVYNDSQTSPEERVDVPADIDDELDRVLSQEVAAVEKEEREKKGQLSTVAPTAGKKRTRDQILAEMKAARMAAAEKKGEELGGRFKKIGTAQQPGTRIERDSQGREVLIIVDEDGHVKRKIRKTQPRGEGESAKGGELPMPDENAKPLGMEVPEQYRHKEEPEDDGDVDIFDGVGDDYDPLAGIGEEEDEESDSEAETKNRTKAKAITKEEKSVPDKEKLSGPRDYFRDSKTGLASQEEAKAPSLSDPSIQAALKKAAALKPIGSDADEDEDEEERARRERRKKMLESVDRDAEDMDMGFGMSRYEDDDDLDEKRVKLSKWGEEDREEGGGRSRGGGTKRKRGPKKRKGDGNNAADVMKIVEQRRATGS